MATKTYDAIKFLKRALIHTFEERLELKARDLNDVNDIYVEAINELAGRLYILYSMADVGDTSDLEKAKQYDPGRDITKEPDWKYRDRYTTIENFPLLNFVRKNRSDLDDALVEFEEISTEFKEMQETVNDKFTELDKSIITLSESSATKEEQATLKSRFENFYDNVKKNYTTISLLEERLFSKQNTLTAGANIIIENGIISAFTGEEPSLNYNEISNKPAIVVDSETKVEIVGEKTAEDYGLCSKKYADNKFDEIEELIGDVEKALSEL